MSKEVTSEKIESGLQRLQRISGFMSLFFSAVSVAPLIALVVAIVSFVNDKEHNFSHFEQMLTLFPIAMQMLLLFAIFATCAGMLRRVSHGNSPFCKSQARHLRIIAYLFLAYAFCDTIANNSLMITTLADTAVQVSHQDAPLKINIMMLALAALFFCFSAIFKYGSLLQEVSDDTI